jgi:hypothetical protein
MPVVSANAPQLPADVGVEEKSIMVAPIPDIRTNQPPPNLLGSFFAKGRDTAAESPLIFRSRVSMAHAMAAAANKINTKIKPPISLMISPYRRDD